jgi:DNA-binding NarL/FixJ family response regulator
MTDMTRPTAFCAYCKKPVEAFGLSWKELEVLQILWDVGSVNAAAHKLYRSRKTVESHLSGLYKKTGTSNHIELVKWALENKFIAVEEPCNLSSGVGCNAAL